MTAVVFVAGLLLGVMLGARLMRRRAYLVCQRQALRDHAPRPVIGEGFNPSPPRQRRRSPDGQFVWRAPVQPQSRPVLHD